MSQRPERQPLLLSPELSLLVFYASGGGDSTNRTQDDEEEEEEAYEESHRDSGLAGSGCDDNEQRSRPEAQEEKEDTHADPRRRKSASHHTKKNEGRLRDADGGFEKEGCTITTTGSPPLEAPMASPHALHLLVTVCIHGDERAGLFAVNELLEEGAIAELLARRPPETKLTLMVGNPLALAANKRFLERNLNRVIHPVRTLSTLLSTLLY